MGTIKDCDNNEDEDHDICSINSNSCCMENGYFYSCRGSPNQCIYEYQLCDTYNDCLYGEDEDQSVCDAARNYTNAATRTPGNGNDGTLTCGASVTGSVTITNYALSFSFTMPANKQYLKISMCDTENEGMGYIYMQNTDNTESLYSYFDHECDCMGREKLFGGPTANEYEYEGNIYYVEKVTPSTQYVVNFDAAFVGNYKLSVECSNTQQLTPGSISTNTVCVDTDYSNTNAPVTTSNNDAFSTTLRRRMAQGQGGSFTCSPTSSPTLPTTQSTPQPTTNSNDTLSPSTTTTLATRPTRDANNVRCNKINFFVSLFVFMFCLNF